MKRPKILSIFFGLALLVNGVAHGATINVPGDQPTIQAGIDAASDGDTVLVASGTYIGQIYIIGKEITLQSVSGPEITIIDGRVDFYGDTTDESLLEGFTNYGSDIQNSSPTIKNCKLKGKGSASTGGHGSIFSGSSPTFIGCQIYDGQAGVGGGYDVRDNSSATFINCEFTDNESSSDGGALYILDSTVTIENCKFERNTAGDSGGGIYITGSSSSEIINSNFEGNNSQIYGGAIDCHHNEGDIQISECNFSKNRTEQWGGALASEYISSLTVESCIFSDNGPCWYGGAIIDSWGAPITVKNSVFIKNMAGNGGGIYVLPGNDTDIINCTFFQNDGHDRGGAINGCSPLRVSNSILWDNYSLNGEEYFCGDPDLQHIMIISYSDIDQDGFSASNGNIRKYPLFVDLENGDVHLQYRSPCIDSGTNDAIGLPLTDLDGNPRIINGIVDMGAYESKLENINDHVLFEPDTLTYNFTTDTTDCQAGAVGKFTFDATLNNISDETLSDLFIEVDELSNGNLLLTNDGLIAEGERFQVPKIDDYDDGYLSADEYVDVPFSVCLQDKKPFRFFVNVLGQSEVNITQTPWEMNMGEGIVPFGYETPYYGWEGEYDFASIPPENDSGWETAPDPQEIGFSVVPSTLCDNMDCRYGADFTYFQTFVDVPPDVGIKTFNIAFDGIDDGVQVRVFNSDNPNGGIAGYVFLGESKTIDLRSLIKQGERNRIVLTQTDDCCSESYLLDARITIELGVAEDIDLDEGLVAYYPFNGNANDESGNGYDGTVNGATLTENRFGNANSAYSFDGVDDYIEVPSFNTLMFNEITASMWVKIKTGGGYINNRRIVLIYDGIYPEYHYFDVEGTSRGTITAYIQGSEIMDYSSPLEVNKWIHVAITYDRFNVKLYKNGQLIKEGAVNSQILSGVIYTGGLPEESGFGDQIWDGEIDDIRIYNRVLSEDEMKALYNLNE